MICHFFLLGRVSVHLLVDFSLSQTPFTLVQWIISKSNKGRQYHLKSVIRKVMLNVLFHFMTATLLFHKLLFLLQSFSGCYLYSSKKQNYTFFRFSSSFFFYPKSVYASKNRKQGTSRHGPMSFFIMILKGAQPESKNHLSFQDTSSVSCIHLYCA